tara:strand:- start:368 stop:580 length:213 start_codon:yes stop_codon:yes gene_type:complete
MTKENMKDKFLSEAVKDLRKFLNKVKPKDHYCRGWEDSRYIMLKTLDELEYRSKFMDDKMIRFHEEKNKE